MSQTQPKQHRATADEKASDIFIWLDCLDGKPIPPGLASKWAVEKQKWWEEFRGKERRATNAIFGRLAAQGIIIHKQTKSPCHLLEGEETEKGFDVTNSHQMPPQLINSPLNIKAWRENHRMLRQMFRIYLKKTSHVRFITAVEGPVKLANLGNSILSFHRRLGRLAGRKWLESAGLEFILRKTEMPVQNAGQQGAEQVWLHAHLALRSTKRLGREKWIKVLKKLKTHSKGLVNDAGDIQDEEKQPNYIFKNPVSYHRQNVSDPDSNLLHYERLEILSTLGTVQLYQGLKGKKLVQPLGEFGKFIKRLENRAQREEKKLTLIITPTGQVKLVKIPKPKIRGKGHPPLNLIVKSWKGKRILRGYNGAKHIPKVTPPTKVNNLQPPTPPTGKAKFHIPANLVNRVENYIRQLGQRKFITREIEVAEPPTFKIRYEHWIINSAIEKIPWVVRQKGKIRPRQPGQKPSVRKLGYGEGKRWRINPNHLSYPGLAPKPKIDPATLPTWTESYIVPADDELAPGRWKALKKADAIMKRRKQRHSKAKIKLRR